MGDRVFAKLATERLKSELPADFSRQRNERRRWFGHEVDDALLELVHSRQGEIERLGAVDHLFERIDLRNAEIGRRNERKHESEMRRNAGGGARVVLHPEPLHQLTGPECRDKNNAFELILQSAPL